MGYASYITKRKDRDFPIFSYYLWTFLLQILNMAKDIPIKESHIITFVSSPVFTFGVRLLLSPDGSSETGGVFGIYLVSNILVVWDIPLKLLSCTYFSIFFAASAWTEESSKSNTILDLANSACETHISIHAPMKGATEHDISVTSVPLISIRTPTKGWRFYLGK